MNFLSFYSFISEVTAFSFPKPFLFSSFIYALKIWEALEISLSITRQPTQLIEEIEEES